MRLQLAVLLMFAVFPCFHELVLFGFEFYR